MSGMVLNKAGVSVPAVGESPNMSSEDALGDVLADSSVFLWDLLCFLLCTREYPSASALEPLEPFLESMLLGGFLKVDLQRAMFPKRCPGDVCDYTVSQAYISMPCANI